MGWSSATTTRMRSARHGCAASQRPPDRHRGATAAAGADLEAAAQQLGLLADAGKAQVAFRAERAGSKPGPASETVSRISLLVAASATATSLTLAVAGRVREQLLGRAEERDLGRQRCLRGQLADLERDLDARATLVVVDGAAHRV